MRIKCRKKRPAPLEPEQARTKQFIQVCVDLKKMLRNINAFQSNEVVKNTTETLDAYQDQKEPRYFGRP